MDAQTPNNPQAQAAKAGVGLLGKISKIFKRGGGAKAVQGAEQAAEGAAHAGMQAASGAAAASKISPTIQAGALVTGTASAHRVLGKTYNSLSKVNQVTVYSGMIAGAFGMMKGLPLLGKAFEKAEGAAQAPGKILKEKTVRDASHAGSAVLNRVYKMASSQFGSDEGAPEWLDGLEKAHEKLGKVENRVLGAVGDAAGRVFEPLGDFVDGRAGKFIGEASARITQGADEHYAKATEALYKAYESSVGVDGVAVNLDVARDALGSSAADLKSGAFNSAINQAQLAVKKAKGDEENPLSKSVAKGIQKALAGAEGSVGIVEQRSGLASKIKSLPENIKSAPEKLANANLHDVALKGAAITGTALQLTGTAKGVGEKVTTLKMMYSDMTGESKISTRKLLFSKNVPDVIKTARSQILKEYGPRIVLNFANTVATYTFMKNTKATGMIASFGLMGVSSLHASKAQTYDLLPMYEAMATTPDLQPEHYAAFISSASPQARAAGGPESQLVQAIAVDYAKAGMRPADILKEIQGGEFDQRALTLKQELIARNEQAKQTENLRPAADPAARAVIGQHTGRLQGQAAQNAASPVR